jgi:hypothetical protein
MAAAPGTTAARNPGVALWVGKALEALGVLNKGSAGAPATPSPEQAAQSTGISTNALNVTRVGGVTAFIAAVGAAALAIFNVDKAVDKPSIVVAAYIGVGVIVASALLTVAIIINADIRSRVALATAATQAATPAKEAAPFAAAWQQSLNDLKGALERLRHRSEDATTAWLDATASSGATAQLKPAKEQQAIHARLQAGQSRVLSKLEGLIGEANARRRQRVLAEIQVLLDSMERSLQG